MKKLILSLILSITYVGAAANDILDIDDLRVYGFISQTAVKSSGVNIGGSSGDISFDKNDISLFAEKTTKYFDIRGAIGIRDEPGLDDNEVYIRYLLIDNRYFCHDGSIAGIRLGKVPHSLGFYNKWRHNPKESDFIYLPDGIYREQFKWLAMSGWGVQKYYTQEFMNGVSLQLQATITKPELVTNNEIVAGHLGSGSFGEFKNSSLVKTFNADIAYKSILIHYDYTLLDFNFNSNMAFLIPSGDVKTGIHTISARYYVNEDFDVTAEYIRVKQNGNVWQTVKMLMPFGYPEGYNVGFGYRVNDKVKIAGFISEFYNSNEDKTGKRFEESVGHMLGISANQMFVKSKSLALNYTIDTNWTVKLQYTQGNGTNSFVNSLNINSADKWNYSAAELIYSF